MSRKKSRSGKKWWTPPYNYQAKRFKTKEEWTKSDDRAYAKAKRDGLIKASKQAKKQLRGPKGKFASTRPKKRAVASAAEQALAAGGIVGPAAPEVVWVEREHECAPPVFTGLHDKVAVPIEETRAQVAQIQRDIAEMKGKLRLASPQPTANPIETLAIINGPERPEGALGKLFDAARDNPLIAMAVVGAAIFVGYLMYRNYRRSHDDVGPSEPVVAELQIPIERPIGLPIAPRYGPSKPIEPPSNLNLPSAPAAFGSDKDGEGIFS